MKRILLFLGILGLSSLYAHSQVIYTAPRSLRNATVVDTARHTIYYRYSCRTKSEQKYVGEDLIVLQIGRNVSKSYSYNLYRCDSLSDVWEREGRSVRQNYHGYTQREVLYTSLTDKMISVVYRSIGNAPALYYQESIPSILWQIGREERLLLGYKCIKATARYRGRNYIAWFASEIPISSGPWMFGQLPGLILEIYDKTGEVCFSAEGISRKMDLIYVWNWKSTRTTRLKARQAIERMFKNPNTFLKSVGGSQLFTTNGPLSDSESFPYNPIELE